MTAAQGVWQLSGTPDRCALEENEFSLRVADASGSTDRSVALTIKNTDAAEQANCIDDKHFYMIPISTDKAVIVPL